MEHNRHRSFMKERYSILDHFICYKYIGSNEYETGTNTINSHALLDNKIVRWLVINVFVELTVYRVLSGSLDLIVSCIHHHPYHNIIFHLT